MIKWEEKKETDQTLAVIQKFFKNKYESYVKQSNKEHGQFKGADLIKQVTQRQEHLDTDLQDCLEQLAQKTEKISTGYAHPIKLHLR